MSVIKEYILATRPWSFTAGLVPVLVTAAVLGQSFASENFVRALLMALSVQSGANLVNTYFDFVNGVDTKTSVCGDMTLVEKKITPMGCITVAFLCFLVSIASVFPALMVPDDNTFILIFSIGIVLAVFYTADPVGLKYRALGDVVIFACFGPLLMQATSLILTGQMHNELNVYGIPLGLLTEGILHANNARDIKADAMSGAATLATLIGFDNSLVFYQMLLAGAYMSAAYIALHYHIGCLATFLTAPLAIDVMTKFKAKAMTILPEETAKLHLPFGVLLLIGILTTSKGLLETVM
jgi:1,4-dihydroxy-2-naphthoate octaprenyltransferase